MEYVDKTICELVHKEVDVKFNTHEKRLNAHSERLDKLSEESTKFETEIKHLCETIKSLTTTLWWFIGIILGGICTFFFTALQKGVIK